MYQSYTNETKLKGKVNCDDQILNQIFLNEILKNKSRFWEFEDLRRGNMNDELMKTSHQDQKSRKKNALSIEIE